MPKAIAVFPNKGKVIFSQISPESRVYIDLDLYNLSPDHLHGFHVHECGDLSEGCQSMCAHFNPYNKLHGGPKDNKFNRHVGDLGNIRTDKNGIAKYRFSDPLISLYPGKCSIIGRGLIIHKDTDDLGLGENEDSLITGNAGKRIACAVIGIKRS
jgi:superoxide dismutase, Cu-Zn family